MKFSSNGELCEYLLLLESQLNDRGAGALSKDVAKAARTGSTFPATEFPGESGIALRHVLAKRMDFERDRAC